MPRRFQLNLDPIDRAERAVKEALLGAARVFKDYGDDGRDMTVPNIAMAHEPTAPANLDAERRMVEAVARLGVANRAIASEHKPFDFDPRIPVTSGLVVIAGLDGRRNYERSSGSFVSTIAIFDGGLRFRDVIAAGLVDHHTKQMFMTARGKGLMVSDAKFETFKQQRCDERTRLGRGALVGVDERMGTTGFDRYHRTLVNRLTATLERELGIVSHSSGSAARDVASVLLGESTAAISATQDDNHVLAATWALMRSAGGSVTTVDGRDFGDERVESFDGNGPVPVLFAANRAVQDQAIATWNQPALSAQSL